MSHSLLTRQFHPTVQLAYSLIVINTAAMVSMNARFVHIAPAFLCKIFAGESFMLLSADALPHLLSAAGTVAQSASDRQRCCQAPAAKTAVKRRAAATWQPVMCGHWAACCMSWSQEACCSQQTWTGQSSLSQSQTPVRCVLNQDKPISTMDVRSLLQTSAASFKSGA